MPLPWNGEDFDEYCEANFVTERHKRDLEEFAARIPSMKLDDILDAGNQLLAAKVMVDARLAHMNANLDEFEEGELSHAVAGDYCIRRAGLMLADELRRRRSLH